MKKKILCVVISITLVICLFYGYQFNRSRIILANSISNTDNKIGSHDDEQFNPEDFKFAGITIGFTKEKVKKILKKPLSIKASKDSEIWNYNGIKISFYNGWVGEVEINTSKYSTFRGIRVGDSIEEIKKKYGSVAIYKDYIIFYQFNKKNWTITFDYKDNRITKMRIETELVD